LTCSKVAVLPSIAAGGIGSWQTLSASAGTAEQSANAAANTKVFNIIEFLLHLG
jgi:hypothetical protein